MLRSVNYNVDKSFFIKSVISVFGDNRLKQCILF